MDRVVVVGGPGSGKTSLSRRLASALQAEHVELDEVWWQPGWVPRPTAEFHRALLERLEPARRWVVDGNYMEFGVEHAIWSDADTLVRLDFPRRVGFVRAVRRAVLRVVRRETLWNGNRETFAVLSPMSLLRLWRRWPSYSASVERVLAQRSWPQLNVVRLRRQSDVTRWLEAIPR